MLSRVTIFKAVFYMLYTTDRMGSNGRMSVINKKEQNALKESLEKNEEPIDLDLKLMTFTMSFVAKSNEICLSLNFELVCQ